MEVHEYIQTIYTKMDHERPQAILDYFDFACLELAERDQALAASWTVALIASQDFLLALKFSESAIKLAASDQPSLLTIVESLLLHAPPDADLSHLQDHLSPDDQLPMFDLCISVSAWVKFTSVRLLFLVRHEPTSTEIEVLLQDLTVASRLVKIANHSLVRALVLLSGDQSRMKKHAELLQTMVKQHRATNARNLSKGELLSALHGMDL